MAARARQLGVALRPHAKTHKCVELGRLQLEQGARGLTVSTLVEAEVFARTGFDDLTWAFPIDPSHIPHARRVAEETGSTLRVVVDDERTARSEEHTSELQSRLHLVCRLLLEKKKKKNNESTAIQYISHKSGRDE